MNIISRRNFLHATAAASAAVPVFLSNSRAAAQAVGANSKIRLGVIGCGGMGKGDLAAFLANPEVDVPIVCDIDDAHATEAADLVAAQRTGRPEMVSDFRRVLDRQDVDAVLIATPDHWHALPAVLACQAGKDVYVEKPLGRTIDEGRAMLEAAKQHNRVVQMGTQWRSAPHMREAVEFVQSGRLGKIRSVRAWAYLDWVGGIGNPADGAPPAGVNYDMWLGPAPQRPFNPNRFHFNFRWYWDYAGGLMTDWGVHLLNVALWAQGMETPAKVCSYGGKKVVEDNTETPDTQFAVYDFPSYTLVWEHQLLGGLGPNNSPHGLYFSGTEGALQIDDKGWHIIPEPKKDGLKTGIYPDGNTPEGKVAEPVMSRPEGPDGRPFHVRNFLDCLSTREDPAENLTIGHHVSTVAHLGNLALRTGSEIHWDAVNERVTNNPAADALVGEAYRTPWELPYRRRNV